MLTAQDLENGFERAELPDGSVAVWDRQDGGLTVRRPPDMADAQAVVGLDGTPTMPVWCGRLGTDLERRQVIDAGERQAYPTATLGNRYVGTTDANKPYAGGQHVDPDGDTRDLKRLAELAGMGHVDRLAEGGFGKCAEWSALDSTGHGDGSSGMCQ